MSILQDALDRSNNRLPRQPTATPRRTGFWLLIAAVALTTAGVSVAVTWWIMQPSTQSAAEHSGLPKIQESNSPSQPLNAQQQMQAQPQPQPQPQPRVRLAGRVTLPEQQPLRESRPQPPTQAEQVEQSQPYRQSEPVSPQSNGYTLADGSLVLGAKPSEQQQQQLQQSANQASVGTSQNPQVNDETALIAALEAALADVEKERALEKPMVDPQLDPLPKDAPQATDIPKPSQLPQAFQDRIPRFNISAHIYAAKPQDRWLSVDGVELQQGDRIQGALRVVEIRPQDVVLELDGTEFRVDALAGW
ncbi:general secretion pathway protein GspB [Paraferrimonas haliotis]|uniref:General secretion pathway protein GspB n=1 Tax=Paraferrimonas haliotis TaxID=2013866 RepID=A0AA37TVB7_9GAMM|nr:general secretion pathway protein GspB [Paraferrimonas haliotis]GLS82466.1 general secretion pathway protein GspB [Paraferrimonas haliotis]